MKKTNLLILGSKEYPIGTSDDPIRSGGIEFFIRDFVDSIKESVGRITIITRKFNGLSAIEKTGNIVVCRVPWIRGFYLRTPSFIFFSFLKALRIEFDIILANGPLSAFIGVFLAAIKKKPMIAIPHGLAGDQPQYNRAIQLIFNKIERFVYSKSGTVIFLSEKEKEQFKKKIGSLPGKYEIIPTGIDVKRFNFTKNDRIHEEFEIKKGTILITFVGRLIGVKGVDYLIDVLADMDVNDHNYNVLIVGDGPLRKELEEKAKGLGSEIIFTGWRNDIPIILGASDIFVLPSYSEGLPMALLEAMAAGTACAVTDIGLPVEDRVDALVVPPGDADKLGNALKSLIKDSKLRAGLGKKAKEKAENEFSWQRARDDYMELFNDLTS